MNENKALESILGDQRDDIKELTQVFEEMGRHRLYKEALTILVKNNMEETAPEVYRAFYEKYKLAEEYHRRINEVY